MSGPMISYLTGKRRNMLDVFSPKREIRKHILKYAGDSFDNIIKSKQILDKYKNLYKHRTIRVKSVLLHKNRERFNKSKSIVIPFIKNQITSEKFEKMYDTIYQNIDQDGYIDYKNLEQANRILNLELLLTNVSN